ncbi:MAG: CHAT domain-containing protein [Ginsengibacter sp.]
MKTDQFKKFLSKNSFIVADETHSVAYLLKKVEKNKNAKIIIKKEKSFDIYKNQKQFENLIKSSKSQMKLKKFILLNNKDLTEPLKISSNSILHSMLSNELPGFSKSFNSIPSQGDNIMTGAIISDLDIASDFESVESATGSEIFKSSSKNTNLLQNKSGNSKADSKPYYLVSEFNDEVKTGSTFNVEVFLSRAKTLKSSPALKLKEGWQIDIMLTVRAGLDLEGDYQQSVIVKNENVGKKLIFTLKAGKPGDAAFILMAFHKGILLFSDVYKLKVKKEVEKNSKPVSNRTQLSSKPQNILPDLTLLIHQGYDDHSKLLLNYTLYSPDQTFNLNYKTFKSPVFQKEVSDYFLEFFIDIDTLPQATKKDRLNAVEIMKSRCTTLYRDLFPEELRKILWSIHDKIKSIIINSEEPWIPWETCFVYSEDDGIDNGFFLCEKYEVSRWIPGSNSPISDLNLSNAAFVIPHESKLQFPPEEKVKIAEIIDNLHGKSKEIEASYREIKKELSSGEYSLWHFSGHGTDSQGTNINKYKIILDNGDALTPEDITGMKSMGKSKPLVFFNACQASRPGMGLTGLSGWPKQLINNNISAFIGAYWSVKDSTAYHLSTKFYEMLAAGEPIAAALKIARLHARDNSNDGDPSWLAYTLYADPFAKIATS